MKDSDSKLRSIVSGARNLVSSCAHRLEIAGDFKRADGISMGNLIGSGEMSAGISLRSDEIR